MDYPGDYNLRSGRYDRLQRARDILDAIGIRLLEERRRVTRGEPPKMDPETGTIVNELYRALRELMRATEGE